MCCRCVPAHATTSPQLRHAHKHTPYLTHPPTHRLQEHQRYHEVLVAEETKRRALLEIVYGLEVGCGCMGEGRRTALGGEGGGLGLVELRSCWGGGGASARRAGWCAGGRTW